MESLEGYKWVIGLFFDARRRNLGKIYRQPKDFEKYWNSRTPLIRENVRRMYRQSKTTWQNINLSMYFDCGFELYKNFWYNQWFNPNVIQLYIVKSKASKRTIDVNIKRSLIDSAKFVKEFMSENKFTLELYAQNRQGQSLTCIDHYLKNLVSCHFLLMLVLRKYVEFNREDWLKIPEVNENSRSTFSQLRDNITFIRKLEDKLRT